MATYTITFWNYEPLPLGGASRSKILHVANTKKAVLEWDVNIRWWITGRFKAIKFNGSLVSESPKGSQEVTPLIVEDGENTVSLEYDSPQSFPWENAGTGYVVLRVDADEVIEKEPIKLPTLRLEDIPWYIWVIIALIIIAIIFIIISRLMHKAPATLVKEVIKEVAPSGGG